MTLCVGAPYLSLGSIGRVKVEYNVFDLPHDHVIDMSHDFVGEVPSPHPKLPPC